MSTFDFNPFPIINTDRLILRKLEKTDSRDLFLMRNNEEVSKYIDRPPYKDLFEAAESIEKLNHGIEHNHWIFWVVSDLEGVFLGTICLWNIVESDMVADIGFELKPEFQNKGYMAEAIEAVTRYGLKQMNLNGIWGFTRPENVKAIKLMKNINFELEQTIKEMNSLGQEIELLGYLLSNDRI